MSTPTETAPRSTYEPAWLARIGRLKTLALNSMHIAGISLVSYITWPKYHPWLWIAAVTYYWFFYFRIIQFGLWTADTLKLIRITNLGPVRERLESAAPVDDWPRFLVLVPAYGAGQAIQTVMKVLARHSYPKDRWRAILVSDQPEDDAADRKAAQIAEEIVKALSQRTVPRIIPLHEAALLLYLVDGGASPSFTYVSSFDVSGKQTTGAWARLLLELAARGITADASVPEEPSATIAQIAQQSFRYASVASDGVRAMTGTRPEAPDGERLFSLRPFLVKGDVANLSSLAVGLSAAISQEANQTTLSSACGALRERLLGNERLGAHLRKAYENENPSTSAAIRNGLADLNLPNMHHALRPPGIRNKAAALNFGLAEAEQRGWLTENTHVMMLDSDSLLHSNALALTALEIIADQEPNVIRQLLPITTINFNARNWFVQTIIAADSIAAPGRWAKSVRTQSRADLTAGSGVVIPWPILRYLIRTYGEAWDTKIICEDARLILSQYAMLDGAAKRTKMIPSYVLEAAPEHESVWKTYLAFWRQRIRWAVGGIDEVVALFRVPITHTLVSSRDFKSIAADRWRRTTARYRKFRLLALWLLDHLWWSGVGLAPILWLAAEILCGQFNWALRFAGLFLLLFVPGLVLRRIFFEYITPLIPGGVADCLGMRVRLFFSLILGAGPYVWPVMWAQLYYLLGRRKTLRQWNPATPKPRL